MNILELIFTDIVLERAKKLRTNAHDDDLSIDPPSLDPYVKQAVQDLKTWHPVVMKEVLHDPK